MRTRPGGRCIGLRRELELAFERQHALGLPHHLLAHGGEGQGAVRAVNQENP
jgi:hypothetical protein